MALDFTSLRSAIRSLSNALFVASATSPAAALGPECQEVIRAGVIQNFEFTYELCWKFLKRWLDANLGSAYVDGVSRKELFRLGAEHRLIQDTERWLDYHRARNLTAHTYRPDLAAEVCRIAPDFLKDAEALMDALDRRND